MYSSEVSHEMAYVLADTPLGSYTYGGALVAEDEEIEENRNGQQIQPLVQAEIRSPSSGFESDRY